MGYPVMNLGLVYMGVFVHARKSFSIISRIPVWTDAEWLSNFLFFFHSQVVYFIHITGLVLKFKGLFFTKQIKLKQMSFNRHIMSIVQSYVTHCSGTWLVSSKCHMSWFLLCQSTHRLRINQGKSVLFVGPEVKSAEKLFNSPRSMARYSWFIDSCQPNTPGDLFFKSHVRSTGFLSHTLGTEYCDREEILNNVLISIILTHSESSDWGVRFDRLS